MANPQKENGYVPVSNEIFEALGRTRIPGEARQILDVIIRQTYGFQKKEDAIALSQFCEKTGLRKPTVCRSIAKLANMNLVVIKKDNDSPNGKNDITEYSLNKNYEEWKPLSKKITLTKKIIIVDKKDNKRGLNNETHKRNYTKDITKDNATSVADSSVSVITKYDSDPLTCDEFVSSCRKSPNKHIQIIGEWAEAEQPKNATRGEWKSFITRNLRAAKNLTAYEISKIEKAYNLMLKDVVKTDHRGKKVGFLTKYSLETIGKYIDLV